MTKTELIKSVATATGDPKAQVATIYDAIMTAIKANLVDGDGRFAEPDLGVFVVISRHARKGRNPKTGEEINIPATKTVKFRPAAKIGKALNGK